MNTWAGIQAASGWVWKHREGGNWGSLLGWREILDCKKFGYDLEFDGDHELKLGNFRKQMICRIYYIHKWLETFSTTVGGILVGQYTKTDNLCFKCEFPKAPHGPFLLTEHHPHLSWVKPCTPDTGYANNDSDVFSWEFTPNIQISHYLLQMSPWNPTNAPNLVWPLTSCLDSHKDCPNCLACLQ